MRYALAWLFIALLLLGAVQADIPVYCKQEFLSRQNLCLDSNKTISTTITPKYDGLNGLDVFFYKEANTTDKVYLRLKDPSGKVLRESTDDMQNILDQDFTTFTFERISQSMNRTYTVELSSNSSGPSGDCIGVLDPDITGLVGTIHVNGQPVSLRIKPEYSKSLLVNIITSNKITRKAYDFAFSNYDLIFIMLIFSFFAYMVSGPEKSLKQIMYSSLALIAVSLLGLSFWPDSGRINHLLLIMAGMGALSIWAAMYSNRARIRRILKNARMPADLNLKAYYTMLAVLFLAGTMLRAFKLNLYGFLGDELISVLAAKGILQHGLPVFESGLFYARGLLHSYLLAGFFSLFGISELTARIPSVIFGAAAILIVCFIAGRWFNRNVAILSAALIAFSSWAITWSRQARMYSLFMMMSILSVYVFYEGFINGKKIFKLAYPIIMVLTLLSHSIGVFLVLSCFLYYAFMNRGSIARFISDLPYLISCFVLGLAFVLFQAFSKTTFIQDASSQIFAITNIEAPFLFLFSEVSVLILLLVAVSVGIGIISGKKELNFINSVFVLSFLLFTFIVRSKSDRYIINLLPLILISAAAGLYFTYQMLRNNIFFRNTYLASFILLFVVMSSFFVNSFAFGDISGTYYDKATIMRVMDYRGINDFVKNNYSSNDTIITNSPAATDYYFRKPDYYIMEIGFKLYQENPEDEEAGTDKQIGTPWINSTELRDLIQKSGNIWLILDHRYPSRFNCDTIAVIDSECQLRYSYKDGSSYVYFC